MKQDIFDRIMAWEKLSSWQPFYKKYKEPLLYLFFGGLAFFLSICLFWVFTVPFEMNAMVANIVDWIICVTHMRTLLSPRLLINNPAAK